MMRFWIIAVVATSGVFLLSGCAQQGTGGAYPNSEPPQRTITSRTLGIDLISCPKAEPEELGRLPALHPRTAASPSPATSSRTSWAPTTWIGSTIALETTS